MTYPITPNPAIHTQPKGIGAQQELFTGGQLQTWAEELPLAMTKDLVDAVLKALGAPQSAITLANDSLAAMAATIHDWLNPTAANAQLAYTTLDTLFNELGLPAATAEALAEWLSGVKQTANSSQTLATTALVTSTQGLGNWTGLLAALEQGNIPELTDWLTTAFTNAENAWNHWIAVLEAGLFADIEAFITWLNGLIDDPTFNALLTALFGAPAVSNLTVIENDIINFLSNAITGGSAPTSSTPSQPSPAATLLDAFTTIPHTNVVIPPSPGSGSITHDVAAHPTQYSTPTNNYVSLTWNHTCASTANYLIVRIGFYATSSTVVSVSYNSVTMQLLQSEVAADGYTTAQIYGLSNPSMGSAYSVNAIVYAPFGNYIQVVAAASDSYAGVGSVGTTAVQAGHNTSPSMTVSSASGDYIVQTLALSSTVNTETLTGLTGYTGTPYNSGDLNNPAGANMVLLAGDAAGSSSVSLSATANNPSPDYWAAVTVNLIPLPATVLGSVFRAANTSTSTVSASSGNNLFVNAFFNSTTGQPTSTDLTYAPTNFSAVTITHAGTYSVTISVLLVSTFTSQLLGLNLVQTPFGGSAATKRGHTAYINNPGFSTNFVFSHTFQVYCNANDVLQPGYYCSTSGSTFTGTADGLSTYFEVSLNNRGLHS